MSFCSFSYDATSNNFTNVDNIFISDYLADAPNICAKVYIYGLFKCENPNRFDNTLSDFAKTFNVTEEDIESAFKYWEGLGLVQVISTIPIEVKYLPVRNAKAGLKKFKKEKYEIFASNAQDLIKGRMITTTEYNEYFEMLSSYKMKDEALLMIIKYAINLKGEDVGYPYIITIAKNWANKGILTPEQVEQKFKEFELESCDASSVINALGYKRSPSSEEIEMLAKWKNQLDFDIATIIYVAKMLKKNKFASFEKLNNKLISYYEMKKHSILEIEAYENEKQNLLTVAKNICKNIGIYYDNLEIVVDTYVSKWVDIGFDNNSLQKIALCAFKNNIKNLEGVDALVQKFYKLGLINSESIDEYLDEVMVKDDKIRLILTQLGIIRGINNFDRDCYNTWINEWKITDEVLEYGCKLSSAKNSPVNYLNKLLALWHNNNVTDVETAKKFSLKEKDYAKKQTYSKRDYSKEELNALFDNINEVEI